MIKMRTYVPNSIQNFLNTDSLSETDDMYIPKGAVEDCSDHSRNNEYQNETVNDISVNCCDTSTLSEISDNVNTLPYNDSTIMIYVFHHLLKIIFLP